MINIRKGTIGITVIIVGVLVFGLGIILWNTALTVINTDLDEYGFENSNYYDMIPLEYRQVVQFQFGHSILIILMGLVNIIIGILLLTNHIKQRDI